MNWRGLILNRFRWKVFSLVIAILVWNTFQYAGGTFFGRVLRGETKNETKTANWVGYKPRILTRQGDYQRYRIRPDQVEIAVAGPPAAVDQLELKDILAFVDAQQFREGTTNLVPVQVRVGSGFTVVRISPEEVRLERVEAELIAPN